MRNDIEELLKQARAVENFSSMRAIYDFKNSSAFEKARKLIESPIIKAVRELDNSAVTQTINHYYESPAARMIREIDSSSFAAVARQFQNSTAFEQLHAFQHSSAFEALRSIQSSPLLDSFTQLSNQINAGYGTVTFSEAYDYLSREYEGLNDGESLEDLTEDISERSKLSPNDRLSTEFYLNVILALVLFIWSQNSSEGSDDEIIRRISQLENVVTEQFIIPALSKNELFLTPDRDLNLRLGPSADHDVISVLIPDQKVRELERERDWIRVEYFSYEHNENVSGWAHSKFLLVVQVGSE